MSTSIIICLIVDHEVRGVPRATRVVVPVRRLDSRRLESLEETREPSASRADVSAGCTASRPSGSVVPSSLPLCRGAVPSKCWLFGGGCCDARVGVGVDTCCERCHGLRPHQCFRGGSEPPHLLSLSASWLRISSLTQLVSGSATPHLLSLSASSSLAQLVSLLLTCSACQPP